MRRGRICSEPRRPRSRSAARCAPRRAAPSSEQRGRGSWPRSEPEVPDAPAVLRQVLPLVQAVEVIDGEVGDETRLRHPQVHRDPPAAVLVRSQPAPVRDASAPGAEVEAQRVPADVRDGLSGDDDVLAFVAIRPQDTLSTARRAVAGVHRLGQVSERPASRSAVARAFDHAFPSRGRIAMVARQPINPAATSIAWRLIGPVERRA
jgi:hypothetical protein